MIKNCDYCQKNKSTKFEYGKISRKIETKTPYTDISSDAFGPFESSPYHNDFNNEKIYNDKSSDRCTNYTKIHFSTTITSSDIIEVFKMCWLTEAPLHKTILTNNANYYTSDESKDFLSESQISHKKFSPLRSDREFDIGKNQFWYSHCPENLQGTDLTLIKVKIENHINKLHVDI